MAKKKAIRKIPKQRLGESADQPPADVCPECGSPSILGLMASFWVPLNPDGSMKGQFHDYESATELGDARSCVDCGHEFTEK